MTGLKETVAGGLSGTSEGDGWVSPGEGLSISESTTLVWQYKVFVWDNLGATELETITKQATLTFADSIKGPDSIGATGNAALSKAEAGRLVGTASLKVGLGYGPLGQFALGGQRDVTA